MVKNVLTNSGLKCFYKQWFQMFLKTADVNVCSNRGLKRVYKHYDDIINHTVNLYSVVKHTLQSTINMKARSNQDEVKQGLGQLSSRALLSRFRQLVLSSVPGGCLLSIMDQTSPQFTSFSWRIRLDKTHEDSYMMAQCV